ncbi:MAG: metalloregulator ArsR/SmtB family transcription factor [Desulfobulbaceae bacterium]|nr:metalloregulator ArsR/SmtB family transcription factor [Desulfobulbaceae bacterium]
MEQIAQFYKALSDETRLRITALLLESKELCVCDLMAVLDLAQSTASRHLAYMRNSALVDGRRVGVWMHYTLQTQNPLVASTLTMLKEQLSYNERAKEDRRRLVAHLATKETDNCS